MTPPSGRIVRTVCNEPRSSSTPCPSTPTPRSAYGRVYTAVVAAGRKARGPGAVDLLIAATALANELPLYTRNADDFRFLDGLVDVIPI